MARKPAPKKAKAKKDTGSARRIRPFRLFLRGLLTLGCAMVISITLYSVFRPPTTATILSESMRLGGIQREWVDIDDVAPVMARAVVAAEDANFCLHWGFDMAALRLAIAEGADRGASTLTQQVVKNVWLWQGRSWPRKALEALMTPMVEALWSKRRIVEVYLNVAEFDEGVFGIEAAARHHFGIPASELSARQASLLAAVLPNPKERQAVNPSTAVQRRAASIADGAATIRADGRAACFED
ncbi:monofunctional biosynthetic peptidoglycan transglycosylase [Alphaproteobacteria bacterium GH1-50]|uniref:Biosynthetic peptidoglycan transglycosylase n=1 Tax=Kangsaoukella pontilimi TaxID=2691042 RepID=A0A7C9IPS9_9RHOB|nr:monofunctional biosynthetic peptidoglycan transglycosylase [Kangsaoukella pontilimi]MXQ08370.1 monofunctional biosynthetic peptidoglycan transglycosylase [Kangsaoukella pontilimi]